MIRLAKLLVLSSILWTISTFTQLTAEELSFQTQKDRFAIGIHGGIGVATFLNNDQVVTGFPDAWWSLSLHVPKSSALLSIGFGGLGAGSYGVNATLDVFLFGFSPIEWLELSTFLGAAASLYSYKQGFGGSTGLRMPLNISFWIVDWFEAHVTLTPSVGFGLGVHHTFWVKFHADAPVDIGVRFWIPKK